MSCYAAAGKDVDRQVLFFLVAVMFSWQCDTHAMTRICHLLQTIPDVLICPTLFHPQIGSTYIFRQPLWALSSMFRPPYTVCYSRTSSVSYLLCLAVGFLLTRCFVLHVCHISQSPSASMEDIYADLDNKTPCIFILSTGADPTSMLLRFAKVKTDTYYTCVISQLRGRHSDQSSSPSMPVKTPRSLSRTACAVMTRCFCCWFSFHPDLYLPSLLQYPHYWSTVERSTKAQKPPSSHESADNSQSTEALDGKRTQIKGPASSFVDIAEIPLQEKNMLSFLV